jgi:hypothetical protein
LGEGFGYHVADAWGREGSELDAIYGNEEAGGLPVPPPVTRATRPSAEKRVSRLSVELLVVVSVIVSLQLGLGTIIEILDSR